MTTHNPPSDPTNDYVGHCVGTTSETPLRANASDCVGPVPLPTGTDAVSEPQSLRRPTTSTQSQNTTICGHREGPWICNIIGPHDIHPDGRTRHYYRAAA